MNGTMAQVEPQRYTISPQHQGSMLCQSCRLIQLQPPITSIPGTSTATTHASHSSFPARIWSRFKSRRLRRAEPKSPPSFDHYWCILHPSMKSLRLSASKGCHLCRMLFAGVAWQAPDTHDSEVKITLIPDFPNREKTMYWTASEIYGFQISGHPTLPPLKLRGQYDFGVNPGSLVPDADEKRYHDPATLSALCTPDPGLLAEQYHSTGSPTSITLLKTWLDHCQENHSECSTREKPVPSLPTRVIDVGDPTGTQHPFLVISSPGQVGQYVTLSHCWGQRVPLTTTQPTLSTRRKSIPLASLPRTFAEAVQVARDLGHRYLWIDSLCILQDSETDWELESSRMGDYYWNSSFTIAAAASTDASQGIFRLRDTAALYPCTTTLQCRNPAQKSNQADCTVSITFSPRLEDPKLIIPHDWRQASRYTSTLSNRGWILQEQILSRRVLSFGRFQISYSCLKMFVSENTPCGQSREIPWLEIIRPPSETPYLQCLLRSTPVYNRSAREGGQPSPHAHYAAWLDMLKEYSTRDLTKERDILPALSGLASRFNSIFLGGNDKYLAGLWRGDLKKSLLWTSPRVFSKIDDRVYHGVATRRPDMRYVDPSWSPTSVKTLDSWGISFPDRRPGVDIDASQDVFVVNSASTIVQGSNPYGVVIAGELKVKCRLKTVHVGFTQGPSKNRGSPVLFDLDMRGDFPFLNEDVSAELDPFRNGDRHIKIPRIKDTAVYDPEAPYVFCVPVVLERVTPGFAKLAYKALVLTAVGSGEQQVYRRLGTTYIPDDIKWFETCPEAEITII